MQVSRGARCLPSLVKPVPLDYPPSLPHLHLIALIKMSTQQSDPSFKLEEHAM